MSALHGVLSPSELLPVDDQAEAGGLGPSGLNGDHERVERDVLAPVEHELVDPAVPPVL